MSDAGKKVTELKAVAEVSLPPDASEREIADFVRGLSILDDVTLRARRVAERLMRDGDRR